ncbi:F-box/LRR-repeat protein 14 [Pyrus ussuriensis x Pyrus communis]|uniref:F-box/LRR-repeat protein 14 n=1 Tax=Pyrus ussuriensis x Pyrus communis TaxID=2448454 RepID=A0A5N5GGY4_9ROSA|nr:F-box/LRR-repeat protein 14 [Pyrus ussuriensis x Pyrus communis]
MDFLPDQLVWEILSRIKKTTDRISVSLACKHMHVLDNEQRQSLRVGYGLDPANEALTSLCSRFANLTKVEITYAGWMSKLGKQLDHQGLLILSNYCPSMVDLTLSYCMFITDVGIHHLSSCSKFSALKDCNPKIINTKLYFVHVFLFLVSGIFRVYIHLSRCLNISRFEWFEYLGKLETLKDLSNKNCRATGEEIITQMHENKLTKSHKYALIKLGSSWKKSKCLQFEVDADYRYMKQWVSYKNMVELSLVNCIISSEQGLARVLGNCKNLELIHWTCVLALSPKLKNPRSIFLCIPSDFLLPLLMNNSGRSS